MLTVDEHDLIRRKHLVDGMSPRAISREVFMPLAFEPGEEAEVDWHEGWIEENAVQRKAQFFCMRLCYSKASFVWSHERANLESFLDGHVRAFEYFGGVPRRLAYDNLESAVLHVSDHSKPAISGSRRFVR